MSGKKLLLDTNIVIKLFAGDKAVVELIKTDADIFVPSIVIGELYYGAELSIHKTSNIGKIELFAKSASLLSCDAETAKHYGHVKASLKLKGTPIPENDLWIAALAIQHKIVLVTLDKHFNGLPRLVLYKW